MHIPRTVLKSKVRPGRFSGVPLSSCSIMGNLGRMRKAFSLYGRMIGAVQFTSPAQDLSIHISCDTQDTHHSHRACRMIPALSFSSMEKVYYFLRWTQLSLSYLSGTDWWWPQRPVWCVPVPPLLEQSVPHPTSAPFLFCSLLSFRPLFSYTHPPHLFPHFSAFCLCSCASPLFFLEQRGTSHSVGLVLAVDSSQAARKHLPCIWRAGERLFHPLLDLFVYMKISSNNIHTGVGRYSVKVLGCSQEIANLALWRLIRIHVHCVGGAGGASHVRFLFTASLSSSA